MLDISYSDTWRTRDSRLAKIGITYQEFLLTEHWKQVKQKAMTRDCYTKCKVCGTRDKVELHHTSYKWLNTKDELRNVLSVCRKHHQEIHDLSRKENMSVRLSSRFIIMKYNPCSYENSAVKRLSREHNLFLTLVK